MFGASQSVVSRRRLKGFDESVGAAVRIGSVHSEDMQWGQARRGGGTGGSIRRGWTWGKGEKVRSFLPASLAREH